MRDCTTAILASRAVVQSRTLVTCYRSLPTSHACEMLSNDKDKEWGIVSAFPAAVVSTKPEA